MKNLYLGLLLLLFAAGAHAQDTIKIACYEDYYLGDAQFTTSVDGVAVAGTSTCTARSSSAPQTITLIGSWGTTVAHTIKIAFTNDAYGGPGLDRNLYVTGVGYDGKAASAGTCMRGFNGTTCPMLATGNFGTWITAAAVVTPPPTTPTLTVVSATVTLTAPSSTTHTVTLNWAPSTSTGITGYNVYRSNSSGTGYVKLNSTTSGTLSYIDNTVSNTTTYYYVVTAVNPGGESGYSNQASAVIP